MDCHRGEIHCTCYDGLICSLLWGLPQGPDHCTCYDGLIGSYGATGVRYIVLVIVV